MSTSKSRRSHFLVSVLRIDHTALRGVRWSEVAREHAAGITPRVMIPSSVAIDLPLFAENRNPQKARSFHHVISLQSRRLPCLTRARFRANQDALWQCVGRGEDDRADRRRLPTYRVTGTRYSDPADRSGFGGPLGVANRATATIYNRAGGYVARVGRWLRERFAMTNCRGPAGDTRRSIPPAHR
jgi:hypothetical protein